MTRFWSASNLCRSSSRTATSPQTLLRHHLSTFRRRARRRAFSHRPFGLFGRVKSQLEPRIRLCCLPVDPATCRWSFYEGVLRDVLDVHHDGSHIKSSKCFLFNCCLTRSNISATTVRTSLKCSATGPFESKSVHSWYIDRVHSPTRLDTRGSGSLARKTLRQACGCLLWPERRCPVHLHRPNAGRVLSIMPNTLWVGRFSSLPARRSMKGPRFPGVPRVPDLSGKRGARLKTNE